MEPRLLAKKFLRYSFRDGQFEYDALTEEEKGLCTREEFKELIAWIMNPRPTPQGLDEFEYHVVEKYYLLRNTSPELKEFGDDGWVMTAVVGPIGNQFLYYFMRPKMED